MWAQAQVALKEWAALCAALATGRHSVLLRKGGIREPRLELEHRAFWLLPTYFHAREPGRERDLADEVRALLAEEPPLGALRLGLYAEVEGAYRVDERGRAHALAGLHGLAPALVDERFDYRGPGLWVLVLRAYRARRAAEVPERPGYAGCVSWVHLDAPVAAEVEPALSDGEHAARVAAVRGALGGA